MAPGDQCLLFSQQIYKLYSILDAELRVEWRETWLEPWMNQDVKARITSHFP